MPSCSPLSSRRLLLLAIAAAITGDWGSLLGAVLGAVALFAPVLPARPDLAERYRHGRCEARGARRLVLGSAGWTAWLSRRPRRVSSSAAWSRLIALLHAPGHSARLAAFRAVDAGGRVYRTSAQRHNRHAVKCTPPSGVAGSEQISLSRGMVTIHADNESGARVMTHTVLSLTRAPTFTWPSPTRATLLDPNRIATATFPALTRHAWH